MNPDLQDRPVVYDYGRPADFLASLLAYHKRKGPFSLRQRAARAGTCSQALVSQVLRGKRRLSRENLSAIAAVLRLTAHETEYLDRRLATKPQLIAEEPPSPKARVAQNHLLADWLHPYVKDLAALRGFRPEAETLVALLRGLAPAARIRRSAQFLLREGFWRREASGQIVLERAAVTTSNGIPNEKIRRFHQKALEIALRGLKTLPSHERKASTVLLTVDAAKLDELKGLVDTFQNQLLEFIERNPGGADSLVQITTHLTPIGRSQ